VSRGHDIPIRLSAPLSRWDVESLHAGDRVMLSGVVYTARDAAHARLIALLEQGKPLPFPVEGQVIYYVGPTPPRRGSPIGSAGPTTSGRMDPYTPALLAAGVKGLIGKGRRSVEVRDALVKQRAVYFAATGGAGALLARRIKSSEVVAWEDLGAEAVRRLVFEDFPLVVINDVFGNDLYEEGAAAYRVEGQP
jgi:fumarate hydratase subunit beta